MPLAAPVTISQQQKALLDTLSAWANPKGGRCAVMHNQRHLWEELADVPAAANAPGPRVMVLYAGESLMLPDQPDCHRVERSWQVVVVRGHGFKDPLNGGITEPFADSVEAVRDLVRAMTGISDYEFVPSVRYVGTKPLPSILPTPTANAFMDGYALEFATLNDIPALSETPPE